MIGRPTELKHPVQGIFHLEKEEHQKFKEIALRENKSMSEIIRELIADYVRRASETPNPQTALTGPPFPNIWLRAETAWEHLEEYPADMLREMVRIGDPRMDRVKAILARVAKKSEETDDEIMPRVRKIDETDINWLVDGKGMTKEQAVEHLKRQGYVE